jgi:hypothetical protein
MRDRVKLREAEGREAVGEEAVDEEAEGREAVSEEAVDSARTFRLCFFRLSSVRLFFFPPIFSCQVPIDISTPRP